MKNLGQRSRDLDIVVKEDLTDKLTVTPVTTTTFRIYGQSVGFYRLTQVTTIYTHATSTSSPYIVTGRSGDIIHIVRIESNITYWVMYGGLEITALLGGTVSSSSSDMYTPIADISTIKGAYIKSATVSGNDLILTKQDNTTVTFSGGGGGSSVDIDNSSITKNSSDQIQTVGVIDQNTGNANKQWTGTLAEYNALGTHDADTFYNITDDVDNGFTYSETEKFTGRYWINGKPIYCKAIVSTTPSTANSWGNVMTISSSLVIPLRINYNEVYGNQEQYCSGMSFYCDGRNLYGQVTSYHINKPLYLYVEYIYQ